MAKVIGGLPLRFDPPQSIGSRVTPQQARFLPLQGQEAGEADRAVAAVAVAGADLVEQAELLEQHAVGLADRLLGVPDVDRLGAGAVHLEDLEILARSEEHTSELQSLMRISYAVFCLKKQTK